VGGYQKNVFAPTKKSYCQVKFARLVHKRTNGARGGPIRFYVFVFFFGRPTRRSGKTKKQRIKITVRPRRVGFMGRAQKMSYHNRDFGKKEIIQIPTSKPGTGTGSKE